MHGFQGERREGLSSKTKSIKGALYETDCQSLTANEV